MRKMLMGLLVCLAAAAGFNFVQAESGNPVPVIFDTDIGNDVDDALALAILNAAVSRGECDLLAVTITKSNPKAAEYVQMVNAWYKHGTIPVGLVKDGATPDEGAYIGKVIDSAKGAGFTWDAALVEDSVVLLRRTLAAAEDNSVVIAQVGFSTNLARLLDTPADDISPMTGKELAEKKVKVVLAMAGGFSEQYKEHQEYNVVTDIPSAQKFFSQWPGPICASGFEIGPEVPMTGTAMMNDYNYVDWHPIKESYRFYKGGLDKEAWTWDLTCALEAVRSGRGYFRMSEPGTITVRDNGTTFFTPDEGGNRRIFEMPTDVEKVRIQEAFIYLCSEPVK